MHATWKISVLMDLYQRLLSWKNKSFDVEAIPSTIPLEEHHRLNLTILAYYNHHKPLKGMAKLEHYLEEDILCQAYWPGYSGILVVVYYNNMGVERNCFTVTAYRRFKVALRRPAYVVVYDTIISDWNAIQVN
uniref:Alpha-macroglobulin receptor-binding domain-containing protein n=1 Tax=Anopheles culicifacies TaxID=139723 RepID=A0A182M3N9_9DIPT